MASIEASSAIFEGGLEFLIPFQTEVLSFIAGLIYVLLTRERVLPRPLANTVLNAELGADGSDDLKDCSDVDESCEPRRTVPSVVKLPKVNHAKAIREYGKEGNLDAAVIAFEGIEREGSAMTPLLYNSMLEACVQCGDMALALSFLREATALKVADSVSINIVMKGFLAVNNVAAAWELLADMRELGMLPSHHTYHSLLHSCAQTKDREVAWLCITQMRSDGLEPNSITCTILFKLISRSVCTPADMPRVMAFVDGLGPMDEALFTSFVEACLHTRNLDLPTQKLQDCKVKDVYVYPKLSAPAYGAMIHGNRTGASVC